MLYVADSELERCGGKPSHFTTLSSHFKEAAFDLLQSTETPMCLTLQ